jgi:hypothetical protein
MGRHTHPDDIDDEPAPIEPPVHKTSAVADLHLIMRNPRLLGVCAIVVVLPFICYFVVMISVHKMDDWALFIGAPMVLAGVLVGAVLDRAYSRLERDAPQSPSQSAPPVAPPAAPVPDEASPNASVDARWMPPTVAVTADPADDSVATAVPAQ